jgi:hypothetical protein
MAGAARSDRGTPLTRALGIPTMKEAAARARRAGAGNTGHASPFDERALGRRAASTVRARAPADAAALEFEWLGGRLRLRRSGVLRSTKRSVDTAPARAAAHRKWSDPFTGLPGRDSERT